MASTIAAIAKEIGGMVTTVDASGTTDYFEIYAYQATGGSVSIDGTARATFFTGGRTF